MDVVKVSRGIVCKLPEVVSSDSAFMKCISHLNAEKLDPMETQERVGVEEVATAGLMSRGVFVSLFTHTENFDHVFASQCIASPSTAQISLTSNSG